MAKQTIDLGTGPDTPGADNLYEAFVKVNENTDELYNKLEAGEDQFSITIPDNTLDAIVIAKDVVYNYWQITESSTPPNVADANWDNGPIDSTITLPDWSTHTYYLYVKNSEVISQVGTEGVTVTPKDTVAPTGTLTLSANATNPDTSIDWIITSSDSGSGIDTTATRLIDGATAQAISIGSASGTIVGLNASTEYTYFAEVFDNYGNIYGVPSDSLTTAAPASTAGTINFTETANPAYEIAEDGGPLTVSLTLSGRSGADLTDTKSCTCTIRELTTVGTSQVTDGSPYAVSFGSGATTDTFDITLTDQSLTENKVFEVYITDGSAAAAVGTVPTIGPNNSILVYLTGSGTTAGTHYPDYDDGSQQVCIVDADMSEWSYTQGTAIGENLVQTAVPVADGAQTNCFEADAAAGGVFVNPGDLFAAGPAYNEIPINLSATGNWYLWARGYASSANRTAHFGIDRNHINDNQFAKIQSSGGTFEWTAVGDTAGATPVAMYLSSGNHTFYIASREVSSTIHWDQFMVTDNPAYDPRTTGLLTSSTLPVGEDATDDLDNPAFPFGPITTSKVTPILSPADNATDQQTNVKLVMTFTGMTGLRLNTANITVTNAGAGANGSWFITENTATFTLDSGQLWSDGATAKVVGTDIGSIVDTDGVRKSIEDITDGGANDWSFTITTPGTYIQQINFESIVVYPRDVVSADIKAPNGIFHSEEWSTNPTDAPDGGEGNTLRFVQDPLNSGKGVVLEHGVAQGNGSWNYTGKTLQTRHFDIVNPVGGTVLRDVYHAMDVYVPSGYVAPSSVHMAAIWSSPDHLTHGSTSVLDGLTRDKCRIGLNFYGILSGYNPPYQCVALYVYHNRFSQGWYGPYWANSIDPQNRWKIGSDWNGLVAIPTGRWFRFECRLKLNSFTGTTPNNDGIIQMWIDGKLVIDAQEQVATDNHGKILAVDHDLGINMVTHGFDYAGDSAIAVDNDKIYQDNIRFATFPMTH